MLKINSINNSININYNDINYLVSKNDLLFIINKEEQTLLFHSDIENIRINESFNNITINDNVVTLSNIDSLLDNLSISEGGGSGSGLPDGGSTNQFLGYTTEPTWINPMSIYDIYSNNTVPKTVSADTLRSRFLMINGNKYPNTSNWVQIISSSITPLSGYKYKFQSNDGILSNALGLVQETKIFDNPQINIDDDLSNVTIRMRPVKDSPDSVAEITLSNGFSIRIDPDLMLVTDNMNTWIIWDFMQSQGVEYTFPDNSIVTDIKGMTAHIEMMIMNDLEMSKTTSKVELNSNNYPLILQSSVNPIAIVNGVERPFINILISQDDFDNLSDEDKLNNNYDVYIS